VVRLLFGDMVNAPTDDIKLLTTLVLIGEMI
jgi:hypothetical protein